MVLDVLSALASVAWIITAVNIIGILYVRRLNRQTRGYRVREIAVLKGLLLVSTQLVDQAQHDKLHMRDEHGFRRLVATICSHPPAPVLPPPPDGHGHGHQAAGG